MWVEAHRRVCVDATICMDASACARQHVSKRHFPTQRDVNSQ